MVLGFLTLFIIYLLHQYITAWIKYYNKTDETPVILSGDGHMIIRLKD